MKLINQTSKLVPLGFIYALVNPKTKEIFYIEAAESSPKDRLLEKQEIYLKNENIRIKNL